MTKVIKFKLSRLWILYFNKNNITCTVNSIGMHIMIFRSCRDSIGILFFLVQVWYSIRFRDFVPRTYRLKMFSTLFLCHIDIYYITCLRAVAGAQKKCTGWTDDVFPFVRVAIIILYGYIGDRVDPFCVRNVIIYELARNKCSREIR